MVPAADPGAPGAGVDRVPAREPPTEDCWPAAVAAVAAVEAAAAAAAVAAEARLAEALLPIADLDFGAIENRFVRLKSVRQIACRRNRKKTGSWGEPPNKTAAPNKTAPPCLTQPSLGATGQVETALRD